MEKKPFEREPVINPIPKNFKFVKKDEEHDISFRRVGVYAGEISTETKNKSPSSHYFIKFLDKELKNKIDKFQELSFPRDNTVGARSISKPELIKEFNKLV